MSTRQKRAKQFEKCRKMDKSPSSLCGTPADHRLRTQASGRLRNVIGTNRVRSWVWIVRARSSGSWAVSCATQTIRQGIRAPCCILVQTACMQRCRGLNSRVIGTVELRLVFGVDKTTSPHLLATATSRNLSLTTSLQSVARPCTQNILILTYKS